MAEQYRVLVLGGYGHFGARIVRALARTPGIAVAAAGRHPQAAAANLPGVDLARVELHALDSAAPDFTARLAATHADLVIHTAGPFQGQDYAVAVGLSAGGHALRRPGRRTRFRARLPGSG